MCGDNWSGLVLDWVRRRGGPRQRHKCSGCRIGVGFFLSFVRNQEETREEERKKEKKKETRALI